MINVSVSQLVNQVDKCNFTLYAEWKDTYFKIILLRPCTVPLSGEMDIEKANYFLDHLDESFEIYLEKTRLAFSGKNIDIQFFLYDDTFTWKQQNILTRGEIAIFPLSNILTISDILKQLLELYQKCQEEILTLEKENKCLNESNIKLTKDIEEMINVKDKMEKDLYTRFLLLLNTKKKRIKELQKTLDSNKKITKSIYDETTDDESEKSDVESKKVHNIASSNSRKRKMDYKSEQKTPPKNNKMNFKISTNFSSNEDTSPEPSTSRNKLTSQNIDMSLTIKSKHVNISEEESEEDLFSQ
ncbi:DNA repair protein XRCC4-like [Cataglyphis hispanica]|uniref:DNA repair protein XRCC4-like n=1 Tax=Cataglyphis hispanica TaxID=1086592 RepID=UPI002180979E|nr:DNA repair protein XRCC4-like [Cataglyphis hispanica]